jgi:hypothetical protein
MARNLSARKLSARIREGVIVGAASLATVGPVIGNFFVSGSPPADSRDALRSDWTRVGKSIKSAARRYDEQADEQAK